jgi:hypothetical protein
VTERPIHGHTQTGRAITDAEVEKYAAEAEAGYDVDELLSRRPKRGRPSLGTSPASVESVRLDPELQHDLVERAISESRTTSAVIRDALRDYLSHSGPN